MSPVICDRCLCVCLYDLPHDLNECIGSLVREREKDKAALALMGEMLKAGANERERCARIADDEDMGDREGIIAKRIARRIREGGAE
jgi:hypothetical protein